MRKLLLLGALALALLAGGTAWAADARDLARGLAGQPGGVRLRLHLDDGSVIEGRLAGASADSVRLVLVPEGRPVAFPLASVAGIRREGGAAGRGWRIGRNVGIIGGALAGFLFAALIDAVGEGPDEVTTASFAALTVGAAATGAVAAGGAGALLASGGRHWHDLVPAAPRPRQRIAVQAGLARAKDIGGRGYDGAHLRLWLPRRVAGAVDLGPEASWSDLARVSSDWDGDHAEVGGTWSAGLAARLGPAAPGCAPFAALGLGWYGREDRWLGISYGLGLRWRRASGAGFDLEVRFHTRSSGLDPEPANGLVTVTAGWTLDP